MELTISLQGKIPLLMHNSRLSNPQDEVVKKMSRITSKRKKTEDDLIELQELEWNGGLYHDPLIGPYIPGENIERCFRDAAAATRNGKDVQRAVVVEEMEIPLLYQGSRDPDELWKSGDFKSLLSVKVGTSRVMRCRPQFRDWAVEFTVNLETALLEEDTFREIVERAGRTTGLGDFRPRYGRFNATIS